MYLIIGADNLINLHKWSKWKNIPKKCNILVYNRHTYKSKALKSLAFKQIDKEKLKFVNFKKVNMVEAKKFNLIIFAPNIKVGGGLVLLQALINQMPQNLNVLYILNESLKNTFQLDTMRFVSSSLLGRIKAEILVKRLSRQAENVCCFHGSPTLFRTKCRQSIYIQNALLILDILKSNLFPLNSGWRFTCYII